MLSTENILLWERFNDTKLGYLISILVILIIPFPDKLKSL